MFDHSRKVWRKEWRMSVCAIFSRIGGGRLCRVLSKGVGPNGVLLKTASYNPEPFQTITIFPFSADGNAALQVGLLNILLAKSRARLSDPCHHQWVHLNRDKYDQAAAIFAGGPDLSKGAVFEQQPDHFLDPDTSHCGTTVTCSVTVKNTKLLSWCHCERVVHQNVVTSLPGPVVKVTREKKVRKR